MAEVEELKVGQSVERGKFAEAVLAEVQPLHSRAKLHEGSEAE